MKLLICLVFVLAAGCGKYGPPVPPTALAPEKPGQINMKVVGSEVVIAWANPSSDRRGKSLLSLDSVRIYKRKLPSILETNANFNTDWSVLTEIPVEGFSGKAEKSAPGPVGAVASQSKKSSPNKPILEFRDNSISNDAVYQYAIAGTNQGGVLGESTDIYQVSIFKNGTTEVISIPNSSIKF